MQLHCICTVCHQVMPQSNEEVKALQTNVSLTAHRIAQTGIIVKVARLHAEGAVYQRVLLGLVQNHSHCAGQPGLALDV